MDNRGMVARGLKRRAWAGGVVFVLGLAAVPAMAQHATNSPGLSSTTVPAGTDIPDRGAASPKELLESMAGLLGKNGPPQDWLSFEPPANREPAKQELQMAQQLGTKAASTADLVEQKIGKTQADMVRTMQRGVSPGCELALRSAIGDLSSDGKVDWSKTKITEDGDKARVTVTDGGLKILMIKVGGKWYLGEGQGADDDTLAKDVKAIQKMNDKLVTLLDQLTQKVTSGEVNKGNFIQAYSDLINAMYSGDVP